MTHADDAGVSTPSPADADVLTRLLRFIAADSAPLPSEMLAAGRQLLCHDVAAVAASVLGVDRAHPEVVALVEESATRWSDAEIEESVRAMLREATVTLK